MALVLPDIDEKEDIADGGGGSSQTVSIVSNGFQFQRGAVKEFFCPGVADFETYLKLIGKNSLTTFNLEEFRTTYCSTVSNLETQYSTYYNGAYRGILYEDYRTAPTSGYISLNYNIDGVENADLRLTLPGTTPHFKKQILSISGSVGKGWVEIIRNPTSLVIQPNTYAPTAYPPLAITAKTFYPSDFDDGVIPLFIWCGFTAAGGGGSASGCNADGESKVNTNNGSGGGAGASGYGIINLASYANDSGITKLYCYVGPGGAGGSATASGQDGSGKRGADLHICTSTPDITGDIVEAKGGFGGRGTTVGGGGKNTITSFDYNCYYATADEIGSIHTAAVSTSWRSDLTSWVGGDGGGSKANGNGPGNSARSGVKQFIVRNTPFCWPPSTNNTNTWYRFSDQEGGVGSNGGGGGSSWFGVGGRGGSNTSGVGGGPGAGGGGGGFKTGTWNSGGKGGDGQIIFYY